jgi:8-oxo-dGTP diphosphatase
MHDGLILAAKRLPGGSAGERWEFPGGKVEAGEAPTEALAREILEELDLKISVDSVLGTFVTQLEKIRIHLQCFRCELVSGEPQLRVHSAIRWCLPAQLPELDWAIADIPAVHAVLSSTLTVTAK